MITLDRVRELASGVEPEGEETQEIAQTCVNIIHSTPEPLGYLWRWRQFVEGASPGWNYSPNKVNHPDIECRFVFDLPHFDEIVKIRADGILCNADDKD